MPSSIKAYVEVGRRRAFAGALDWPGWCRSARDGEAALEALSSYGPRYRAVLDMAGSGIRGPAESFRLEVAERVEGNATTDFGAPAIAPPGDERPVGKVELERLRAILKACWAKFDQAVQEAEGKALRKGPRGGGRDLDAIVDHVLGADGSYVKSMGGMYRKADDAGVTMQMTQIRTAVIDALSARARGEPVASTRRRSGTTWFPRYGARRVAWHALDHAWEIEDRAMP